MISVITPSYERPNYIKSYLESLSLQTYKEFEVIIIDDGSDKEYIDIIREYEKVLDIKYIRKRRIKKDSWTQPQARNLGIKLSQGDILFINDDDTYPLPNCLEAHARYHSNNDKVLIYGEVLAHKDLTPNNIISYIKSNKYPLGGTIRPIKFIPKNFSVKKRYVVDINGYDRDFNGNYGFDDLDFHDRLIKLGLKIKWLREAKSIAIYGHGHGLVRDNKINKELYYRKKKEGIIRCKRGLE